MIPLAPIADPSQVARVRPLLEGRACVIVGSAPLSTRTAVVERDEVRIAVNGAIASLPDRTADLWVLNSKAQDRPGSPQLHQMHRLMLAQAERSTTDHLLLLRGPTVASENETLEALRLRQAVWQTWSVLDKPTKRWMEGELCDRRADKWPCSSGILATACALWCGAASVRMVGFSWAPGYHYLRQANAPRWWRNHVEADQRALRALCRRYPGRLHGALVPTGQAVAS